MTEFKPGQTAQIAHRAIKSALKTMDAAKQCSVLWFGEILTRKLYRDLGFSSINQYAAMELGFSSSRIGVYLNLCRHLEKLPLVKEKIASGKLGYTKAEALLSVVGPTNEKQWVEFAEGHSRKELEQVVKRVRQDAADQAAAQPSLLPVAAEIPEAVVPVSVNLKMSPTQYARYESLWEQLRKQTHVPAEKVEALLDIMTSFLERESPAKSSRRREISTGGKPPVQIHIHECPRCATATVQTGKGELAIGKAELERARCDCRTSKVGNSIYSKQPNQRNTSSIPPATRRQVLAAARHRCQQHGCPHNRYLEVHHIIPRSKGGTHDPTNLICLCSACHKLIHEKGSQRKSWLVKERETAYGWSSHQRESPCPAQRNGPVLGGEAKKRLYLKRWADARSYPLKAPVKGGKRCFLSLPNFQHPTVRRELLQGVLCNPR